MDDIDIIKLLGEEMPEFHLKSQTKEMPNVENHFFKNGKSTTDQFETTSYAINIEVLNYLKKILMPEFVTIETGCGYSTIVFATMVSKHICVNPDITSNLNVKRWMQTKGCVINNLAFEEGTSDVCLPRIMQKAIVDVALIDGSHSFPIPFLDFHYIDIMLKRGGILILDNTEINTVNILDLYLQNEVAYELLTTFDNGARSSVFTKKTDDRTMGWLRQSINVMNLSVKLEMRG